MKKLFERYGNIWRNGFNFHDPISRSEYWLSVLSFLIVTMIGVFAGSIITLISGGAAFVVIIFIGAYLAYLVATIIPLIALETRRFIDVGIQPNVYFILLAINFLLSGISVKSPSGFISFITFLISLFTFIVTISATDKYITTKYIGIHAKKD